MNADNTTDHDSEFIALASNVKNPRIWRKITRYECRNIEIPTYGTSSEKISNILDLTRVQTSDDSKATRVFRAAQNAQNAQRKMNSK